jgi:hypothetical protein
VIVNQQDQYDADAYDTALADIVGDLTADGMDHEHAVALAHEQIAANSLSLARATLAQSTTFALPERDPIYAVRVPVIADAIEHGYALVLDYHHPGLQPASVSVWLDKVDAVGYDTVWRVAFADIDHAPSFVYWPGVLTYLGALARACRWHIEPLYR